MCNATHYSGTSLIYIPMGQKKLIESSGVEMYARVVLGARKSIERCRGVLIEGFQLTSLSLVEAEGGGGGREVGGGG